MPTATLEDLARVPENGKAELIFGLLSEDIVRVYRASSPDQPTIYRRGDAAEAEPAVPGWVMLVEGLFPYFVK